MSSPRRRSLAENTGFFSTRKLTQKWVHLSIPRGACQQGTLPQLIFYSTVSIFPWKDKSDHDSLCLKALLAPHCSRCKFKIVSMVGNRCPFPDQAGLQRTPYSFSPFTSAHRWMDFPPSFFPFLPDHPLLTPQDSPQMSSPLWWWLDTPTSLGGVTGTLS